MSRLFLGRLASGSAIFAAASLIGQAVMAQSAAETDAMEEVCGSCHTVEFVVSRNRSRAQWKGILENMVNLGATGTDEQFRHVVRYILTRLTTVNVNKAPQRDIAVLLGIPVPIAEAIVAERKRGSYRSLTDLLRVPGLDRGLLERLKDRITF